MIACDTSTLSAMLGGAPGEDVDLARQALFARTVILPPAAFAETLSHPVTAKRAQSLLEGIKLIEISEGYWQRVANIRAGLLQRDLKARLADALIAQSCIDADVPLITRDRDFQHFAAHCGLRLATQL